MTESPRTYFAQYSHWNVHSGTYTPQGSSGVEPPEMAISYETPEEIADFLLREYISESHLRGDGGAVPYPPVPGEYRVQLWEGTSAEGAPVVTRVI